MKGTRGEIIEALRRHGELTVTALAAEIGIAAPALRRHLDILAGEGMVEYRAVRQATGRPYFAYRLTEQALESSASGYARLLERLLQDAAALPTDDGRRALLDTLLERMSQHMAEEYGPRVRGATVEERVRSLTEALRAEGLLDQWEQRADGIHLITSACPHRRAAMAAHDLCTSELRAITSLLGQEVEQVGRMVDGNSCCEYLVRPRDAGQLVTIE